MGVKTVSVYEDPGGWVWKIVENNDDPRVNDVPHVIARGPAFGSREEALKSMFGIFFGYYDESFLTLYAEWNPEAQFVETQDVGEPVTVQASFDGMGGLSAVQQSHDLPSSS